MEGEIQHSGPEYLRKWGTGNRGQENSRSLFPGLVVLGEKEQGHSSGYIGHVRAFTFY